MKGNKTDWFVSINPPAPSYTEKIIADILQDMSVYFYREVCFRGMKYTTGYFARYDFYLPDFNTCIEYDGEDYHSDKKSIKKDKLKTEFCKIHKIKLIRLNIHNYRNGLENEVKILMDNSYYVRDTLLQIEPLKQKRSSLSLQKRKEQYRKKVEEAFKPTPNNPKLNKKTIANQRKVSKLNKLGAIYPPGYTQETYKQKKEEIEKMRKEGWL